MTEASEIYIPINQEAIDALIERNASLVKGLTEETKKGIISELTEGMIKGEGIDQLVARISKYVDSSPGNGQSRAERIARTEVMYALNRGALSRYGRDGIQKVAWLAGPDDRCCPTCIDNNGKVFNLNEAPGLPIHPNCRCTWVPYFDDSQWLDNWNDEYHKSNVENYAIYDEYGNRIGSGSGTATGVEIKGNTKDLTVIHNHPNTIRADFSNGDLKYAYNHDVKEMVVVSATGDKCSISRPSTGWPNESDVDAAWNASKAQHKDAIIKIRQDVAYGKLSDDQGLVKMQELLHPTQYQMLGLTERRG